MTDFAAIDFETANMHPSSVCSVGLVIVRRHYHALADAEACAHIAIKIL